MNKIITKKLNVTTGDITEAQIDLPDVKELEAKLETKVPKDQYKEDNAIIRGRLVVLEVKKEGVAEHTSDINNLNDKIATKQDKLVSGTTIKTINNESLLGEGNISISGGSGNGYTKAETDAKFETIENHNKNVLSLQEHIDDVEVQLDEQIIKRMTRPELAFYQGITEEYLSKSYIHIVTMMWPNYPNIAPQTLVLGSLLDETINWSFTSKISTNPDLTIKWDHEALILSSNIPFNMIDAPLEDISFL